MRAAYFLRDVVAKGYTRVYHIAGVEMMSDVLTKALARPLFMKWARRLRDFADMARAFDEATSRA